MKIKLKVTLFVLLFVLGFFTLDLESFNSNIPNTIQNEKNSTGLSPNILSSSEKDKIEFNSLVVDTISQNILSRMNSGDFFENSWISTLESTYHGISVLKYLNQTDVIDIDRSYEFIMGCYNYETNFFSDVNSDILNASYDHLRLGYSQIEATAYAVLSLDLLGVINYLPEGEKDGILGQFSQALNMVDGGFYHRTDGKLPNDQESSSVILSYHAYSAMEKLTEFPLTQIQENALASFISTRQNQELGMDYGGFFDNNFSQICNVETSLYAIKLLEKIDKLNYLNKTSLSIFLNLLHDDDTDGIYNTFMPSYIFYDTPEFFSSACGLLIEDIFLPGMFSNISFAHEFILNGYSPVFGNWPLYNTSNIHYLRDLYLIVSSLCDAGLNIPSNIANDIAANIINFQSRIAIENRFGDGFSPLSKKFESLTKLYQEIIFLNNSVGLDKINNETKTSIYNYIKECVYINSSAGGHSFSEFPEYNSNSYEFFKLFGLPMELKIIPKNVTDHSTFGRGIYQTHAAFSILSMLNLMQIFSNEYDIHLFSQEILDCQIPSGLFASHSKIRSNPNSHSIELIFKAIEILKLHDEYLGSHYFDTILIDDLQTTLLEFKITDDNWVYFSDKILKDNSYEAEMTYFVLKIAKILNLEVLSHDENLKLLNWSYNNPDSPKNKTDYNLKGAIWTIMIDDFYENQNGTFLNLEELRNIFYFYFEDSDEYWVAESVSCYQLRLINNLFSDRFSSFYFGKEPRVFAGFQTTFEINIAGISKLNHLYHNISARILDQNSEYSSWYNATLHYNTEKYLLEISSEFSLSHYPEFFIEFADKNYSYGDVYYNFSLPCMMESYIDLSGINSQKFSTGDIIEIKIGFYQGTGGISTDKKPIIDIITNITIVDNISGVHDDIVINNVSEVRSGINWITFTLNTQPVGENLSIIVHLQSSYFSGRVTLMNAEENDITRTCSASICGYNMIFELSHVETILLPSEPVQFNMLIGLAILLVTFGGVVGIYSGYKSVSKKKVDGPILKNPRFRFTMEPIVMHFNRMKTRIGSVVQSVKLKKNESVSWENPLKKIQFSKPLSENLEPDLLSQDFDKFQLVLNSVGNMKKNKTNKKVTITNEKLEIE